MALSFNEGVGRRGDLLEQFFDLVQRHHRTLFVKVTAGRTAHTHRANQFIADLDRNLVGVST